MHSRPFRSLSAVAVASLVLLGLAPIAMAAGEKDKEATKLFDQAMNEDYLNTDFAKAEKKLKEAVKKCGADGCSPTVLGKIYVALGTVYGVGLNKPTDAKEAFISAFKADPKAALDDSLSNPDLVKIFAEAKKAVPGGTTPKPTGDEPTGEKPVKKPPKGDGGDEPTGEKPVKKPPKGDSGDAGTHTAPPEQVVNTPVPLYFEPSDEVALSKVTLRYKPFGGKQYKSAEMQKVSKGYGGEIPCEDVSTTGDVKYFFALTDENGEAAGSLGSTKEPYKVTIKNEIEGDPPRLPGKKPPDQCKEKLDCPPGLPGCPAAGGPKHGEKAWGSSCEQSTECASGLVCLNGSCEEGTTTVDPKKGKARRNMVGLWLQFDAALIGSKTNVCSPPASGEANNYTCFVSGTSHQYDGIIEGDPNDPNPAKPKAVDGTNGIDGGFKFIADMRVLAAYDRQLLPNLPITVGARLGWAFGGSPTPDNTGIKTDKNGNRFLPNSGLPVAKGFFGFHYELRAAYHFGGSMLEDKKFRPYAFLAFGGGQVNASVPVTVCDTTAYDATKSALPCKLSSGKNVATTVDAYQITGLNFIGFGGGTTFGITPQFGVAAELKFMLMIPTFGFVLAPSIGPVFAF